MNVGARMETQGAESVKGTERLDSASRDQFVLMDEVTWLSVTPSGPGPCRLLPGLEDVLTSCHKGRCAERHSPFAMPATDSPSDRRKHRVRRGEGPAVSGGGGHDEAASGFEAYFSCSAPQPRSCSPWALLRPWPSSSMPVRHKNLGSGS